MIKSKGDPLLTAARIVVILIIAILWLCAAGLSLGIAVLLTIGRGEVLSRIAEAGAPDAAFWVVIGGFALVVVAILLAIRFFAVLNQIIISVDRGTPFEPANAVRLRRMGWLAVAGQLVLIPLGAIVAWLLPYLERLGEDVSVNLGADPGALLLILVLFVLARVFERGAAMQSDLEGTV